MSSNLVCFDVSKSLIPASDVGKSMLWLWTKLALLQTHKVVVFVKRRRIVVEVEFGEARVAFRGAVRKEALIGFHISLFLRGIPGV